MLSRVSIAVLTRDKNHMSRRFKDVNNQTVTTLFGHPVFW